MRKSITILIAVLVCALTAVANTSERDSTMAQFSTADISARIIEAKTLLRSLGPVAADSVRVAALDPNTSQVAVVSLSKDEFLTKGADLTAPTQSGTKLRVGIVRANGVNTAVA